MENLNASNGTIPVPETVSPEEVTGKSPWTAPVLKVISVPANTRHIFDAGFDGVTSS